MRLHVFSPRRSLLRLRSLGPGVGLYLLAVGLVGFVVDGGVFAVLLNLYLLRLEFGPEQIGLVNAAGMLVFALASLPAGALGARFGSRQMMLVGVGLLLAGCAALPLADLLPEAARLPWLIGFNAVLYLGLSGFFVNTAPFMMAVVPDERRTELFAIHTALLSLAAFVGSLVGGALPPLFAFALGLELTAPAPFRYALLVAALAFAPAMLALRAVEPTLGREPPPDLPRAPGVPEVARGILGLILIVALIRVLQVAGVAATNTYFNVYLDAGLLLPTAQIGAIIAAGRLLGVPAALATPLLTARFGNKAVAIGATLGSALSMLPLALIPHWSAATLGFVGLVGLSWIRYAASMVIFLELVPPSRRALLSGVTEMAGGICFTLITFGGGYLIAGLGYRPLFLAAAAVTALSALVFWLWVRGRRS
jgi:MFS family permease